MVAFAAVYRGGLHRLRDLAGRSAVITAPGNFFHDELAQIARHKGSKMSIVTVKALHSFDAVAQAVTEGNVDAAILPPFYERALLPGKQALPFGWYAEIDEQPLGALFATAKTLASRRAVVEKFLVAYRHGVTEYAAAPLRYDS